jgi:hypothetical protein
MICKEAVMGVNASGRVRSIEWRVLVGAIAVSTQLGLYRPACGLDESLPTPPQAGAPELNPSPKPALSNRARLPVPPQGSEPRPIPPQMNSPRPTEPMSIRSGGILNESFDYHHPQPMRSAIELGGIPHATGWYNYGFPMRSYRWGYFGAERHYPRVMWHQGYYGDKVRTAYRYAY